MQSKYLGFCKRVGGIPDHLREVGHHELEHQHEAQALRENIQQPTGLEKIVTLWLIKYSEVVTPYFPSVTMDN
jgi:hypothetical protein